MSEQPIIARHAPREPARRVPAFVDGDPGLVIIDATWGKVQPLHLPGGVETVAELEVIALMQQGALLVDTRQPEYVAAGTLPSAIAIRHQEITSELARIAPTQPIVLFCNGPQCGATPLAIAALLDAGWPAEQLRYYRGGVHDWATLGYPLVAPNA